jgi:dynactin 1
MPLNILRDVYIYKAFGVAPWVTRITQIKESLAINAEAEHKVMQLNDEVQGLMRTVRSRDQTIQESGVKIELLERRMESLKRQADTIAGLEAELVKARKQERTYELAMEQLQSDLDTLEQDNAKLKAASTGHAREGNLRSRNHAILLVN